MGSLATVLSGDLHCMISCYRQEPIIARIVPMLSLVSRLGNYMYPGYIQSPMNLIILTRHSVNLPIHETEKDTRFMKLKG